MGKLTLLLVLAAALGGTVLTMSTRASLGASSALVGGAEADVVAREIAETARSLAVAQLLRDEGFEDTLAGGVRALDGGEYTVDVASIDQYGVTLVVTARYGGAVHRSRSTYLYDPMDVPGPMWIDGPVVSADLVDGARPTISGGGQRKGVLLDPRRHEEHELEEFYKMEDQEASLRDVLQGSDAEFESTRAADWEGGAEGRGLLGNLGVETTQDLYYKALARFDARDGDQKIAGPRTVSTSVDWSGGQRDRITVVDGDLRVAPGGAVSGSGVLVVNGGLFVEDGPVPGALVWSGLVIVQSDADELPIELEGRVQIRGALAVAHTAYPPGGHLDVSVYGNLAGMSPSNPAGAHRGQREWSADRPWFDHSHAFDRLAHPTIAGETRGGHVVYLQGGAAGPYENDIVAVRLFMNYMSASGAGSTPVYLAFGNPQNHGYAQYRLDVAGQPDVLRGTVQEGFPEAFRHPDGGHRSAVFPLDRLRSLDVNVQSLRALRRSFDDSGCGSYPECIGNDWNRRGALAVRLVRASDDKRLYESTLYWHMRQDEVEAYEASVAEWQEKIKRQEGYGAFVTLGDGVDIRFRHNDLDALVEKMDFEPDAVRLVTATAQHLSATEAHQACVGGATVPLERGLPVASLAERLGATGALGPCRSN